MSGYEWSFLTGRSISGPPGRTRVQVNEVQLRVGKPASLHLADGERIGTVTAVRLYPGGALGIAGVFDPGIEVEKQPWWPYLPTTVPSAGVGISDGLCVVYEVTLHRDAAGFVMPGTPQEKPVYPVTNRLFIHRTPLLPDLPAHAEQFAALIPDKTPPGPGRTIVTLCGSTRFTTAYQEARLRETMAGRAVFTIGCDTVPDVELVQTQALGGDPDVVYAEMEALHLWKISISDEVLVLNVGGYIGAGTRREIAYAVSLGKIIRYWEPVTEEEK